MSQRGFSKLWVIAAALAACCWVADSTPAAAQALAYGQIQGTVKDQSGGVIPGATVTVRNQGTGAERVIVSDDSGNYRAVSLQPGVYAVIVEQEGFATLRNEDIEVQVGATVRVNAVLTVAATEETIVVTTAAPVIEPEKTGYTATVSEESVENLPINGRRWENFVLLTPTTQPDGDFGLVSYRGISGLYNNNSVDGADNNQGFFSEARGRTRVSYTLSQSAIKEFQVGVSNYSAEYGRAVGGTVNAVTKSGNNAFHGQAFYFLRDDSLNAAEPFNNAQGIPQLKDRRQQFGFNLGGPIKEDKLFYFLNYDHQLRNFPGVAVDDRQLRDSAGTLFTEPGFNLSEICDFATVGQARCEGARDVLLSRLGPFSRKGLNNVALGKLDWIINDKHNFGAQYNWHKWRSPSGIQTQDRTNDTPLANGFDGVRTDFFLANWTYSASASTLNEFRFQLGRDFEFQRANTTGPEITHNTELDIDDGQRAFLPREKFPEEYRLQFIDNFTWIRGRHMLRFGIDINYLNDEMINLFQGAGDYDFRSFEAFAMDVPLPGIPVFNDGPLTGKHYRDFRQAFDLETQGVGRIEFSTVDWNFYVQDTIKVRPNFTLNLGLRYEFSDLPQPDQGIFANPTPEWLGLTPELQAVAQRFNRDKNNFGPRIGAAWDIGGRNKAVLRGGYGIYYGRTSNSAVAAGLFENNAITRTSIRLFPDQSAAPVFPNTFCDPPLGLGTNSTCIPPAGVNGSVTLNLFEEDYQQPLVQSWDLDLEWALNRSTSLSFSYLGSKGSDLPSFVDINLPAPSETVSFVDSSGNSLGTLPFFAGDRPVDTFDSIIMSKSDVDSWYNAFVLRFKRRWSQGLTFDSHLTISKALDTGQGSTTFFEFFSQRVNPFDADQEKGRSRFDIRKKFVTSWVWDPPFEKIGKMGLRRALEGFVVSGIVTLRDGRAFGGDLNRFSVPFSIRGAWDAVNTFTANGSGADDRVPWLAANFAETTGFANVDLRVIREFRFTENVKVAVSWEAFNLFNHVNFTRFNDDAFRGDASCDVVDGSCAPGSRIVTVRPRSDYLIPTAASNTLAGPREMQLAFKFFW